MRVNVTRKDNYWILAFTGNLANQLPGPLYDVQRAIVEGAREIVLDFSSLGYLSAGGVKNIRDSYAFAKEHNTHLGICAPPKQARAILNLNGIPRDIPVYLNILEAVTRLDLIEYQPEWRHEQAESLLVIQKDLPLGRDLMTAFSYHHLKPQFRIIPVRSLDDALLALRNEKTSCAVLDSSFRVFRVATFLENVLSDKSINNVPFLVVSTEEHMTEAEMMIRHGAHEMVSYPFRPVELVTRIYNLISYVRNHDVEYYLTEKSHWMG